jgi:hypothetical protein
VFFYFLGWKERENSRLRVRGKQIEIKHKQINVFFVSLDGVGLSVQRILILDKK